MPIKKWRRGNCESNLDRIIDAHWNNTAKQTVTLTLFSKQTSLFLIVVVLQCMILYFIIEYKSIFKIQRIVFNYKGLAPNSSS